jgi:hypothetical protein
MTGRDGIRIHKEIRYGEGDCFLMPLEMMLALILVLPIIILFAVFVWFLNIGGIYAALKENHQKKQAVADNKKLETGQL